MGSRNPNRLGTYCDCYSTGFIYSTCLSLDNQAYGQLLWLLVGIWLWFRSHVRALQETMMKREHTMMPTHKKQYFNVHKHFEWKGWRFSTLFPWSSINTFALTSGRQAHSTCRYILKLCKYTLSTKNRMHYYHMFRNLIRNCKIKKTW